MAGEIGTLKEESPVLFTVKQPITVGVSQLWIGGIPALFGIGNKPELIKIRPTTIEIIVVVRIEVDTVSIRIIIAIIRIGWIETMHELPTIWHAV